MKHVLLTFILFLFFQPFFIGQTRAELVDLLNTHDKNKEYVKAEQLSLQLIAMDKKHPSCYIYWCNLGTFQAKLYKYDDALQSYNTSIEFNSKFAHAYSMRGVLFEKLNHQDKAIKDFDKALRLDAFNESALERLGAIHFKKGEYQEARNYLETLLFKNPDHFGAAANLASIKKKQGQLEESLADYNKLILHPKADARIFNERADIFLILKDYDKAKADVEKSIELDPQYAIAHITKGEIYLAQNDLVNACIYFHLAIEKGHPKAELAEYLKKCD